MKTDATEDDVRSLRRRAEQALRTSRPRDYTVRLLRQLLVAAPSDDVETERFAHRHLAELCLEHEPWQAALHLRRAVQLDPSDDIAQALTGLCHALQGNFRFAVAAYRRALVLSPANPSYNHNLGHLLDVALGEPKEALGYLKRAFRAQPEHSEVAASYAHCLGRTGSATEGASIARQLSARHPNEAEHRKLLAWLEQGAPDEKCTKATRGDNKPAVVSGDAAPSREIERALRAKLPRAGHGAEDVARAIRLWRDYARSVPVASGPCEPYVAAVEYALCRVDGLPTRQREVAERWDVSLNALQTRFGAIRTALALQRYDDRYGRGRDE